MERQVLRLEIGADEESRALGSPYRVAEFEAHNPPDETDAEVLAAEEARVQAVEEEAESALSMEQALGAIDAEIGRSEAADSPIEVTFVSHVQTDRTIELYCAGEHVHDLRFGEVYQTSASANERWTARCGGSTVQVWDVRTGRATAFAVPADTLLPVNRGRGRRAAAAR